MRRGRYYSQISQIFFRRALVYEYSDRSPTRVLDRATATQTVTTLSCKRLPTRQQHREELQVHLSTYEKRTFISWHARISTLGNSSFSNQYNISPDMEISSRQSSKSYSRCLTSMTLLLLAPRPTCLLYTSPSPRD